MTAKNVRNLSEGTLGLPGGVVIAPKATVRVANFDAIDSNAAIKSWLDAGMIEVTDAASAKKQGEEVAVDLEPVLEEPSVEPVKGKK